MRVLFQPFPADAHVNAQVPLAWALRAAGHEVRVATQPDAVGTVTRAGLTAVPVGDPLDIEDKMSPDAEDQVEEISEGTWLDVLDIGEVRPERLTHDYAHGVLTAWTSFIYQSSHPPRLMDDIVDFARSWRPDLVVWDTMSFAGPIAARASGAAHARLLFGLDLVGWIRQHYLASLRALPPELRDDPLEEWLGRIAGRYGLEFTEDLVVGQWTVDPVPEPLRLPVDLLRVPVRHVPYNGTATVPDWLRGENGRPRVCLTLGLSFRDVMGGDRVSVSDLLDAVSDLDAEVVATLDARQLASVRRLPDNVRTVDFVPMDVLLPTCSAVIHHSGSGTFSTALVHGVPQILVTSKMWCNVPRARRLQEAGAGIARDAVGMTLEEIRGLLVQVIEDPSYTENATAIRNRMLGSPPPSHIVPVLERLAAEYRTTGHGGV